MTWGRIDDTFYDHPKVLAAGDAAVGLFVRMISYCNRHGTDGVVNRAAFMQLTSTNRARIRQVNALESVGLLHPIEHGWRIHDFGDYNDTVAQVEERREKERQKKRRQRGLSPGDTPDQDEAMSPGDSPGSRPRSRPVPVPEREGEGTSDQFTRYEDVIQMALDPLRLKWPRTHYETRIAACTPVHRAVVQTAIDSTIANADSPNWEYFVQCIETPSGRRPHRQAKKSQRSIADEIADIARKRWEETEDPNIDYETIRDQVAREMQG